MMNRKAGYIKAIEKVLDDEELMEAQRQTLVAFDRFNELENQCRLRARAFKKSGDRRVHC